MSPRENRRVPEKEKEKKKLWTGRGLSRLSVKLQNFRQCKCFNIKIRIRRKVILKT